MPKYTRVLFQTSAKPITAECYAAWRSGSTRNPAQRRPNHAGNEAWRPANRKGSERASPARVPREAANQVESESGAFARLPVQDRAYADQCGSLLGGDGVVLARSHRELVQTVPLCELPEAPEVGSRRLRIGGLRRHRHQAADLRSRLEEPRQRLRGDAGLRLLAREIHLDERGDGELVCRGLRVERVHELAGPVDDLGLVRLQVADEMPAERVAVLGVLPLELLGAVLADDLDPRLDENRHVRERDVLRRRDDRDATADVGADALVVCADGLRRRSRSLPVVR